jgi:hypothetical protein
LGGGLIGNHVEAQNGYYVNQPVQQCRTENTVENRTVAQNVLYEYAGQRFNVQMPANGDFRPGTQIALQVAPSPAVQAPAPVQQAYYTPPVQTVTYVSTPPVVYYESYDHLRPRYFYSTPYAYGPHASRHPVYPVRHERHHGYRDDYRNWR